MHAFKDQLVRSALLALYTARPGCVLKKPAVPRSSAEEGGDAQPRDHPSQVKRQDSIPHHSEYDEEEWVSCQLVGIQALTLQISIKKMQALMSIVTCYCGRQGGEEE